LDVIEPIVAAMNNVGFAGGDIDGEKEMRQFGIVNGLEPIGAGLTARNFGRALAVSAGK
jgi:hypothetical protein